jgi:hypothetical protein
MIVRVPQVRSLVAPPSIQSRQYKRVINGETPMFRRAIPGMICLIAGCAISIAQPSPNQPETPKPPSPSAPATTPDVSETMEEAMPGDHWTYETRDEITGDVKATATNVVTEVTAAAISLRVNIVGKPNAGYVTYDHSWNALNSGDWRYTPNDGTGVRLPLAVGKKWTFQSARAYPAHVYM